VGVSFSEGEVFHVGGEKDTRGGGFAGRWKKNKLGRGLKPQFRNVCMTSPGSRCKPAGRGIDMSALSKKELGRKMSAKPIATDGKSLATLTRDEELWFERKLEWEHGLRDSLKKIACAAREGGAKSPSAGPEKKKRKLAHLATQKRRK